MIGHPFRDPGYLHVDGIKQARLGRASKTAGGSSGNSSLIWLQARSGHCFGTLQLLALQPQCSLGPLRNMGRAKYGAGCVEES